MPDPTAEERLAKLERELAKLTAAAGKDDDGDGDGEAAKRDRAPARKRPAAPVNRLRAGLREAFNTDEKETDR